MLKMSLEEWSKKYGAVSSFDYDTFSIRLGKSYTGKFVFGVCDLNASPVFQTTLTVQGIAEIIGKPLREIVGTAAIDDYGSSLSASASSDAIAPAEEKILEAS